MPSKPRAQSVQAGEQDPLGDITLIELVPALPLYACRYDDSPEEVRVCCEPIVDFSLWVGHDGEQRKLIHDAVVDGGRFKEEEKFIFRSQAVELA